jgi:hypothetical protein
MIYTRFFHNKNRIAAPARRITRRVTKQKAWRGLAEMWGIHTSPVITTQSVCFEDQKAKHARATCLASSTPGMLSGGNRIDRNEVQAKRSQTY